MKYFLRFLFFGILISLATGFILNTSGDALLGNKIVGFTVLTAAFVFMPAFLVHRWKGKKLKDYTLSKENLQKINDLDQKK
ncbi:MAG: hypothetical protein O2878_00505 [Bacteroidetes bacterium]|mgnify:CR=1 FL=1|jgi:RsiW-degrading membrane proteinase PrsW (M82 family)|nr:hypothetical protein [Bacteroidota bacterium]MDA0935586.1 hypothetical protein [Bacteroidota bacterium]